MSENIVNDKFKLWGGGKMHEGSKVFRIQALKDFGDVKKGEKGGYIESEDNLSSKDGDLSWVYDDSIVHGKSTVTDNSAVYKDAIVKDSRIEKGSRVSHNAQIEHTRVTDSEIQNSTTFYANVNNSNISHECTVKNTRVVDSSIENGSEAYNSRVERSEMLNEAKVSRGKRVEDMVIDGDSQTVKNTVTLSDDDLSDLNEPSKGLQQ